MSNKIQVFCTTPSQEIANFLARTLVEEQLAACASLLPGVTSIYRWQGEIESSEEVMLVIKTRENLLDAVRARILELHPYEVPEIIAVPITGGHQPYLDWIDASTQQH